MTKQEIKMSNLFYEEPQQKELTDAEIAYNGTKQQVGQEMITLMESLAKQPRDICWGDVGDMNYILSELKKLNGEE